MDRAEYLFEEIEMGSPVEAEAKMATPIIHLTLYLPVIT